MKKLTDFPDAHLRIFDRPPVPDAIDEVYLIGICGTGMGSLAGLFQQAGYRVRGSDQAAYPPMSTRLAEMGIPILEGFDPAHLDPASDLVIVGNACIPTHVEAAYAREQRLVQQSFPEALGHFFLRDRLKVRGEVGGVLVVDDFAHHPTAVHETIRAVGERWPGRRVVAVFEPRSNSSRRKVFETPYAEAFDGAGLVFLSAPPFRHNDEVERFMDAEVVVQTITARGAPAFVYPDAETLLPPLLAQVQPGDVVLIMSNGSFG
ncbi:MAG: hypothetical protein IH820_14510, partial [Bacteroidetes bacterium]|nr:hypothetical protein [Bacteroidota bacterium]